MKEFIHGINKGQVFECLLNEEGCFGGGAGSIGVKGCGYLWYLSVRGAPHRGSADVFLNFFSHTGISNSSI